MVFCNKKYDLLKTEDFISHNPYFNRWFSAIVLLGIQIQQMFCHNPYFNRWFSAISEIPISKMSRYKVTILILIDGFLQLGNDTLIFNCSTGHNPYFNRWFSAIANTDLFIDYNDVTILILIDGFLQFKRTDLIRMVKKSQSLF